jgi:hypothetical protein
MVESPSVPIAWLAFEEWYQQHPEVYETFVRQCRLWKERTGETRWAVGAAWERMRWVLKVRAADKGFGLNDHYCAYMGRLAMHQEEDLAGMFEVRTSEADTWLAWHLSGSNYQTNVVIIEMEQAA